MGPLAFSLIAKFGGTVINVMVESSFAVTGRVVIQGRHHSMSGEFDEIHQGKIARCFSARSGAGAG